MLLDIKSLSDKNSWQTAGISLPEYDPVQIAANTKANPTWVHFGAGNIFRGFIAELQQEVLNSGKAKTGITAVETFDTDIIDKIYAPHDNLSLSVYLLPDGSTRKAVIASIGESLAAGPDNTEQRQRLAEIFTATSLQMVSFTITEKGYSLNSIDGSLLPVAKQDMENGPENPRHTMAIVTAMLLKRYQNGASPLALVSMDNCSHNGDKLRDAVLAFAKVWAEKGFADSGFISYLNDPAKISFPWSMIDRIVPRPDATVQQQLTDIGLEAIEPVVTSGNTYIAPFVNAEVPRYLVIEDSFPAGRPPIEDAAGVYITDRTTVDNAERMKVCTCLNPLHTSLAVFGCILGYTKIADEMSDPVLHKLVETIGYKEGLPVVVNPGIIDPKAFISEVIESRFPNPFIPDTPQRIATDTSQKMAIRFGATIDAYTKHTTLDINDLVCIPLTIAGWFRYLLAVDDKGNAFELSGDPMMEDLQAQLKGIDAANPQSYSGQLKPLLANTALFSLDLTACGISEKVETMFVEMLGAPGSVYETLKKYV